MFVVAAYAISLRSQSFNVEIWPPALESAGSVFDATDDVIAIQKSDF
jgi:hypothetical protein